MPAFYPHSECVVLFYKSKMVQPELEVVTLSLGLHYSHLVVVAELPPCVYNKVREMELTESRFHLDQPYLCKGLLMVCRLFRILTSSILLCQKLFYKELNQSINQSTVEQILCPNCDPLTT